MIIDHFLTADTLFVLMAVFLGCFVKGALGFGLPLIATPIMMFVLPLPEIVAILVLPIAIANLYQIWLNRTHWRILKKFWSLIAASTLIMLLGAPIMVFLDGNFLGILIGLMIFLHALLSGLPLSLLQAPSLTPRSMQKMIIPAGVVSGLLGTLTSMYSFPSLQLMLMMRVILVNGDVLHVEIVILPNKFNSLAVVPAMHAFALLVMDVILEIPVTNVLQVNTVNTMVLLN